MALSFMWILDKRSNHSLDRYCSLFLLNFFTSHSAYVATATESDGAKIDGSL